MYRNLLCLCEVITGQYNSVQLEYRQFHDNLSPLVVNGFRRGAVYRGCAAAGKLDNDVLYSWQFTNHHSSIGSS